jgi:hypothetical protein
MGRRARSSRTGAKSKRGVDAARKANNAEKMAARAAKGMAEPQRTEAEIAAYWGSEKRAKMNAMVATDFIEREAKPDKTEDAPVQLLHKESKRKVAIVSAMEVIESAGFIDDEEFEEFVRFVDAGR